MNNLIISTGGLDFDLSKKPIGSGSIYSQNAGDHTNIAFSTEAAQIYEQINDQKIKTYSLMSSQDDFTAPSARSLDEALFDACADVKMLTARVSMHLSSELRNSLFQQLDLLHDSEDWDEDDSPVNKASFQSFLRWLVFVAPNERPGLGLSSSGNIIAAWIDGQDRLILEFFANDLVKWAVSKNIDDVVERATGNTHILRLMRVLEPYDVNLFLRIEG